MDGFWLFMDNFWLFLLIVSAYVFIYNMGMYIPAKIFKVRVEKFYIWFNPWFALFKYKGKNSDTEFGLGWLPIGGYCKFSGMTFERMDEEFEIVKKPYYFTYKPIWKQLTIILGGPVLTLIVGLVYYSYLKSIPISYFFNIYFNLFIITFFSIFIFSVISYLSNNDVKKREIGKFEKLLFIMLSLVLYLSILFLLLVNINEVVPLEKYLIEKFYYKRELIDMIFPLTPERTKIFASYFGIFVFIFNLIPYSGSNGGIAISLLYKSFTGQNIPEEFTEITGKIYTVIFLGLLVYINII